ncbi:MAG: ATP synthase F0 subunit A [Planctomycetes bacterium]|nr:ATP synthase F0 subunit A [Planctomycetota bacterium]
MQRFFSFVLSLRGLLMLALVVAACWTSNRYSAHHEGDNVFTTLYMHLVPSVLVEPGEHASAAEHGQDAEHGAKAAHAPQKALFELPLFFKALAPFDYRGETSSDEPKTALFNLQIFQVLAVVLTLIAFAGVPRYLRTGKGDPLTRLFAGFAQWIRDEMVYPTMGKKLGAKFLPYFLTVFFFVAFMNLVGLVPYSATPTASIFVTAALALTTFLVMILGGMAVQGPLAFWKNLVPHVPLALWPLMFVVELIGLIVKPVALTIRLFANMSGGHMVVLSFMGLIFFMGQLWGTAGGWGTAPIGVGFAVFIMIIESFVALVQAYIFTQLSILFINASIHPEH